MSSLKAPEGSTDPSWLEEGLEPVLTRTRPYLEVALQVVRDPAGFARTWVSGTRPIMNPLKVVASAAAVVGIAESLAHELAGLPFKLSAWEYLVRGVSPYVYYAELGFLMHVGLWLVGCRGRKVTTAIAFALYSGGTLATVATLLLLGWMVAARRALGPGVTSLDQVPLAVQVALGVAIALIFVVVARFLGAFGRMAREVYGVGRGRIFVAMMFTITVSSLVATALPLPTLQFVVGYSRGAHLRYPDFADFFSGVDVSHLLGSTR